jgi:hypothetical protein
MDITGGAGSLSMAIKEKNTPLPPDVNAITDVSGARRRHSCLAALACRAPRRGQRRSKTRISWGQRQSGRILPFTREIPVFAILRQKSQH